MHSAIKIAFSTLGCKLNFTETSYISQSIRKEGFQIVPFSSPADVYIINTCTVTSVANKKSRNTIQRAIHTNPEALIIVTGCYAQLKPDELAAVYGVDFVVGCNDKNKIIELIELSKNSNIPNKVVSDIGETHEFLPAYSFGDRTRSFLKIQDGCDYYCNYCTIPLARGRSRNQSIAETVKQAESLAKNNVKEIIITGVNIGDFGKTTNETFIDLLKALDNVKEIGRIRLGSIEPNLLSDNIIDFVANSEHFMPHFHIPLQSGSDNMLKMMRRRYNTNLFEAKIEKINKSFKSAFIGLDVIVGVRGETEEYFLESMQLIEKLNISFVHVFSYSERENTDAIKILHKVPHQVIEQRSKLMHILSSRKHELFYKNNIGAESQVLWESSKKGTKMYGFTDNYIKAETEYDKTLANKVTHVKLTEISDSGNMKVQLL